MTAILFGFLCIVLAFVAMVLQRFYSSIPLKELKRLSVRGDHLAQTLYRPAAYGTSLRTLLWLIAGLSLAGAFLLIIPNVPGLVGFAIVLLTLLVAFVWLPSLQLTVQGAQFAGWVAPAVVWVIRYVHPVLSRVADLVNKGRTLAGHSRLYEKEDLAHLLRQQKEQPDNRISLEVLELTDRALAFSDKQAADVALPRKAAHLVNADDPIGPIVMDQLHKSGQNSFLVYKGNKETIVGSLLLRDAVNAKQGGRVLELVRHDLCYVHEDFSLLQVLTAFQKTGHHTAIVINGFEEFVGVITLDNLLHELLGELPEGLENYENPSAIAAYKPPKDEADHDAREAAEELAEDLGSSPEATGVVE